MINFQIPLEGNGIKCLADVELQGIVDSWVADVKLSGHPTVSVLHVTYRLGDYLTPYFGFESDMRFFAPLLYGINDKAKEVLPKNQD